MKRDNVAFRLLQEEQTRQKNSLNLVASENYVSGQVLLALGSVFTNKYSEGYPRNRYYGGNEVVDKVENLARERALKLFKLNPAHWHVNVQPYSGSPANAEVYSALVPLGEKIMGLELTMGGHLSHGHKVSITSKAWKVAQYAVDKKTHRLDYETILRLARREKPKLIIAGYTAYPRVINFKKFNEIAQSVGAFVMVDMSHFAGLVAGRVYPSPFPYADVVTTTTHKTLRGPRGAMIFAKKELARKIDRAVFPGFQGGPHNHQTLAIAVALHEALQPSFVSYAKRVKNNAVVLALELKKRGWEIITGGTDSHVLLVNVSANGVGGYQAETMLEEANIVVNKNTIPYDERPPSDPSGIRLGTPAVTTRGMRVREMKLIADLIDRALKGESAKSVRRNVLELVKKFPIP
ncbi:MAG: serine hydroxymethyltransferase [Candidatus Ryanbacteria bacterium RIFCSPHIGHO2_02_FULL_45_43]|uniref:Serine hydroxymethyltransferase n=1 Tax=Candidatus Ryanbacteria bacterium RIFCSPHIGHO2_01_45_13 TaxID=1802112 RepID=A0A1G2FWE8_9BACT|nr:MAG: serine hydroxymethyltransferase [Candidatus Ryanbacteria bacterium RIFCSPHIGHO2_01_FULL_44_130]OGZ42404.1 MAG: serine hydroxymethyltransferase [Candidatus Ryanbacteria bacterium RIFCSPHIGHO2_01_45_13]OGZ48422.1 MAG: serine hydroxymethyltransferase [Candidatus Ryanbacteria bacterium RIFCSPHIGHO2_02_FULL_45_43]OGZ50286.1 MAG: serine hydroxymethyltransferase [Candidatus Ryanbacteria bacterium RIFCSPHIGHO2_12_FULL_44_20]OGZ51626.1 MAG: serine hydroxymethyltransferase [Candidatus Ryanbacteri